MVGILSAMPCRRTALGLLAALAAFAAWPVLAADDMPVFKITMKDGTVTPSRLEVPAGRPFKLEITNAGSSPAEFESLSLHKEKVLAAGVTSSLAFRRLEAGVYDFFDDFHSGTQTVLVVK